MEGQGEGEEGLVGLEDRTDHLELEEENVQDEMQEGGEVEETPEEEEGARSKKWFKNLIDKPVAEEIKLFEWCPTMDLLAWITVDDQLVVQRLSWQRLFSIRVHDQPITAITWRPDGAFFNSLSSRGLACSHSLVLLNMTGKIIAVGHQDGKVSLVDVENGTAYFSSQFHSAAITCLHWAQETSVGAGAQHASSGLLHKPHIHYLVDRTERFLQPLPPPPLQGHPSEGYGAFAALWPTHSC
jgi:hypothetical protein